MGGLELSMPSSYVAGKLAVTGEILGSMSTLPQLVRVMAHTSNSVEKPVRWYSYPRDRIQVASRDARANG